MSRMSIEFFKNSDGEFPRASSNLDDFRLEKIHKIS